jgi:hypothetical protein
MRDLRIPPGPRFQITKYLNLAILAQGTICSCGYFDFLALKVELDPQRMGDLIIPPRPRFQITKHLILTTLTQGANIFGRCFEF